MAEDFYSAGHVPPDSSAYVEREFVTECFNALSGGHWVVVLGPRQHGKTSGLVRLLPMLRGAGVQAARISLQGIPRTDDYGELLGWLAGKVAAQLGTTLTAPGGADAGELDAWLAGAVPADPTQIAILIDEAAGIQDDAMRSDLYRQLRRLHDERDNPRHVNLGRGLALLFSGTFEPARLVADDLTSPFNVCRRVESADLSIEDARALVAQVGSSSAEPFIERAYDLVGGQPLLLQHLFAAADRGDGARSSEERFALAETRLLCGESDHVSDLMSSVVSDPQLRAIAVEILASQTGAPFVAAAEHRMLVTCGFARVDQNQRLVPRNRLYDTVARQHPLLVPEATPGPHMAPITAGAFSFVTDDYLRRFAEESAAAAIAAHNDGHMRLALIGLGSALESILIDVLEQAAPTDVTTAVKASHPNFNNLESRTDPGTWRLVNLIKVADRLPVLQHSALTAGHVVRDLRNFVHPAVDRASPTPQPDLVMEFNAAVAVLSIIVRELGGGRS